MSDTLESRARKAAGDFWQESRGHLPPTLAAAMSAFAASEVERALERAAEAVEPDETVILGTESQIAAFKAGQESIRKAIRALKEEPAP